MLLLLIVNKTKLTVTARSVELGSISLATLTINIINTIIISTVGVVMAKANILDIIDNDNVAQIIIVNDHHLDRGPRDFPDLLYL